MSTTLIAEPETMTLDAAAEGGTVYTETIVWSAPQQFVADAPYQLVIITLNSGRRLTGRITGEQVKIGDAVVLAEYRNGVPFFRKVTAQPSQAARNN